MSTNTTMDSRELIKLLREQQTGNERFNAALERCAREIEDILASPAKQETDDVWRSFRLGIRP